MLYLGGTVNTARGCITVPPEKLQALRTKLAHARDNHRRCRIRDAASITGTLVSMRYSFGFLAILMSRELVAWQNSHLAAGAALDHHFPLCDQARGELEFWLSAMERFDGRRPLWQPSHIHTVLHTDASGRSRLSYGGWGATSSDGRQAAGRWTFETERTSSTALELDTVRRALLSFNCDGSLRGQNVLLRTDNQGVYFILNKGGSKSGELQRACYEVLWFCLDNDISLRVDWIPRELNDAADALSKRVESCHWKLNPREFQRLEGLWGPFDIDLFASEANRQLPQYYSQFWTPDTAGVDAFAQKWGRRCWCNPPFALIARVLRHAQLSGAGMCLIVPFWPTAQWWPLLLDSRGVFAPFVRSYVVLRRCSDLFLGGRQGNTVQQHAPRWGTLALKVDFTVPHTDARMRVPDM